MAEPSLRAVRLTKWYGKVSALSDVSVDLTPGIWGLLGPNGSGKSTLLKLAAGQIRPSLGEIRTSGERPFGNPRALCAIGLCPEPDALFDELTGIEFVRELTRLSGYAAATAEARALKSIDRVGLTQEAGRRIGTYSRGMRQRLKLAQAIVHDPQILLLDEPLNGTDPVSRRLILDIVRNASAAGAVVLFSTHVLHELEAVTDRILVLVRGQIVAYGQAGEIRGMLDSLPHRIQVVCEGARVLGAALIQAQDVGSVSVSSDHEIELATRDPDATYRRLAECAAVGGHDIHSVRSPDTSLESLFHHLVAMGRKPTGFAPRDGAASPTSAEQR